MMDLISIVALLIGGLLYTIIGFFRNYLESGEPFDAKRLLTQIPTIVIAFFLTVIPLIPALTFADPWTAFGFGFMGKWATDMTVSIYNVSKDR
jgi:hypothetical protein